MARIFPRMVSLLTGGNHTLYVRPYELNIVGVRSARTKPNRFDDEIHVFYRTGKGLGWNYHVYKATTDPGTSWLNAGRANPLGTAILAQGQYADAYRIGMHKGLYPALVQSGNVDVIRDYDRDARLDFRSERRQAGVFGINIHRAAASGKTTRIGEWSAGCQVFARAEDFSEFMRLCELHRARYGNRFTYTLFDFRDRLRGAATRALLGGVAGAVAFGLWRVVEGFKSEGREGKGHGG